MKWMAYIVLQSRTSYKVFLYDHQFFTYVRTYAGTLICATLCYHHQKG